MPVQIAAHKIIPTKDFPALNRIATLTTAEGMGKLEPGGS